MWNRVLSYLLILSSFYEQLAWTTILIVLATQVGDPTAVGLAASAYSLANLFGNLLFGHLSDRLGRYRVAGAGMLGMAVTGYLHLAAGTPGLLIGARFLHGLTAAAVAPAALAGVSDWAPTTHRGETMARVGLVIAFSSMLAPQISGRLTTAFGPEIAVGTLIALLLVVGLLSLTMGGRAAPRQKRIPAARPTEPGNTAVNPFLLVVAVGVAFALMFGQSVLFYALPLQVSLMGDSPAVIGMLLSAFAVGAAIAFVPPLSRIADRAGRRLPLIVGLVLASGGLGALACVTGRWEMAASLFVYGLGFGLVFTAVSALNADAAGSARRGLAFGLLTAAFSLGAIVGPLVTRGLDAWIPSFGVAGLVAATGIPLVAFLLREPRRLTPPVNPTL
jgi:DHA1 family multidrug resistance protein-like MFS transporter